MPARDSSSAGIIAVLLSHVWPLSGCSRRRAQRYRADYDVVIAASCRGMAEQAEPPGLLWAFN
jgi:hypothetical protein